MSEKFEQLARDLAEAWRSGGTIPLPPAGQGPATRADAYEIQDRMAELIGGQVAGWKVGATVRAVQVFEGHDGPLPGRIFADRLFESPRENSREPVQGREGRVRIRVSPHARSAEGRRAGRPRRDRRVR